jgi:L-malate glycosyltransferase
MSARKKILHVLPWITSGGVERRRLQLVRGLDPRRFEQRLLCKVHSGPLDAAISEAGGVIERVEGRWGVTDLEALHAGLQIVERWQPDIIHGAVFEGMTFAALLGYMGRVPHIIIEETGSSPYRSWRGDLLCGALSAMAHKTVAISPHVARYLTERSHLSPSKLTVITNGVMFPPALSPAQRAAQREAWGIPAQAFVVGSVGRVYDHIKRFSDLIRALASPDGEATWLLIAGAGPDLDGLRALAGELGVGERVVFTGHLAQTANAYAVMDVFALVSANEAFGLVLPEAMSLGLPTIGSRVDAIPDVIVEGQTGLLVPPCDPLALAAAIRRLREHPSEREAMGAAGRARAFAQFSESRYVEDVRAFYDALLAQEPR